MSGFVDDCRSEWKRLGVPDPVADEMAAELAADLEEAEAEGASAEDVLGSGARNARAFAAAWAAERGVIPQAPAHGRVPRTVRTAIALTALALVAIVGAVLVVASSPSQPARVAAMRLVPTGAQRVIVTAVDPASPGSQARPAVVWVMPPSAAARHSIVTPVDPSSVIDVTTDAGDSGIDTRAVGWGLLTVGLGGFVLLTLSWWIGQAGSSRRIRPVERG